MGSRQRSRTQRVLEGHTGSVTSVAVSPDGKHIITGSEDETVRVWELASGRALSVIRGHAGVVTSVAVTPDGTRLVTGSGLRAGPIIGTTKDYSVRVWDLLTGRELNVFKGHEDAVSIVAVTPDGTRVVTGSKDGTARIWDLASGRHLATLRGDMGRVTSIAVTSDGNSIITASPGTVRVWRLFPQGQSLIEEAIRGAPRCLTPTERLQFFLAPSPPSWCISMSKWPYDRVGALVAGRQLILYGKENEAETLFAAVLSQNLDLAKPIARAWAEAYMWRGTGLLSQGKDTEAESQFKLALARDADSTAEYIRGAWVEAYVARGIKLLNESKDDQAEAQFALAVQHDAAAAIRIDREKLTSLQRRKSAAVTRATTLFRNHTLESNPREALNEALAAANGALNLAPEDVGVLALRGFIYISLNRIDEAFADIDAAISRGNGNLATYFARGLCHEVRGKRDAAIADYRSVIEQVAETNEMKQVQSEARKRLAGLTGTEDPSRGPKVK